MANGNSTAKNDSDGRHGKPVPLPPSISKNHGGKGNEGSHYGG